MSNFQEKVSFIWDIADLLRGAYKRSEYQDAILPFVVLKRFDSALSDTKQDVLNKYNTFKNIENSDHLLRSASKLPFYNYSKYDFKVLLEDPEHIEKNLIHYIDCFSKNIQDIFENFEIKKEIEKLSKANRLFQLIKKFNDSTIDLHPDKVDNFEMGMIFEELVRKFAEQSNEEAGEHFTPRDVIGLMTALMFVEDQEDIKKSQHKIKRIYDPACGTGGMLTSAKNYILNNINSDVDIVLYGQEINPKTYAVAKADMLMKGENSNNIKGPYSTLSKDGFPDEKFDYIISNPPYGTKWEGDEEEVRKEAEKGEGGRFGAGLPRINDGQLLFLQHMISKMKVSGEKTRIAVITNGSPLFTGDAGSGESDIRKWIIENDYLEAIIALPNQLFFNTGISTYIWVLTNDKKKDRQGKIQLVDGTAFWKKMRKSLGDKRHEISEEHQKEIIDLYHEYAPNEYCKIFDAKEFGYTKVIIERPLQLNYQVSEERLENLYAYSAFAKLSVSKSKKIETKEKEEEEGKKLQEGIINALKTIDSGLYMSWKAFAKEVRKVLKDFDLKPAFIKNIILCLSEHDDTADYVLDKDGNYIPDTNLRDNEKIKLGRDIEGYFKREVLSYYPDAWMDRTKDKIGYEINFTKYFYKYIPPRDLEGIERDINDVTCEIEKLLKENLELSLKK